MTDANRLRTLQILQRLKEQHLDDCGRKLSEIRACQAIVTQELQELRAHLNINTVEVCAETLGLFSQSFAAISRRKAECYERLHQLEIDAQALLGEVNAAFAEAKTNETLLELNQTQMREARQQDEQAFLSEVATQRYIRRTRTDDA